MKLLICVFTLIQLLSAQTKLNLGTQAANVDFSAAVSTKPFKTGTTLPASCVVGEAFFNTSANAGANWYACTAPNVWTVQSGSAQPGQIAQTQELKDLYTTVTSDTTVTVQAGFWGVGNTPVARFAGSSITIQSLSVTAASNTSPITLTVSDATGSSLRQSDTVMVSGVQGNTAANGTWAIELLSATTIRLVGSSGNGTYTGGGTVAGTGNGLATIYGTAQGYIGVEFSASSGVILRCTGSCVMNQVDAPGFAPDSVPIANLTINAGKWASASDERRFLTARGVQAGQGITVADAGGTATVAVDSTVARTTGTNNYTGANNFTLAARTAPHRMGSGAPASLCSVGDTYFRSDAAAGQNLYLCTSTNTWSAVADGSKAATNTSTSVDGEVAVFSGTTGKLMRRATGTGAAKLTNGVLAAITGNASDCIRVDGSSGPCVSSAFWYQSFPVGSCSASATDTTPGAGYKAYGTPGVQSLCASNDSAHLSVSATAGWILTTGTLPVTWSAGAGSISVSLAATNTADNETVAFAISLGCSSNNSTASATFGTASTISITTATSGRTYIGSAAPAIPAGCTPGSLLKIRIQGDSSATGTNQFNSVSVKVAGI